MQFRDEEEYVGPRDLTEWASRAGSWLAVTAVRVFAWAAPRWVLILTLAVGLGLCAAMTAVAAEIYDAVTDAEGVATLDRPLLDWIAALRTPTVNDAVAAFTALAASAGCHCWRRSGWPGGGDSGRRSSSPPPPGWARC